MSESSKGYWFKVPWGITSPDISLSSNARVLLIALLCCENRFTENPGDWFFTFNGQLQSMCGFGSEDTVRRAKQELEKNGFIRTEIRVRTINPKLKRNAMYYSIIHGAIENKPMANAPTDEVYFEDGELPFYG